MTRTHVEVGALALLLAAAWLAAGTGGPASRAAGDQPLRSSAGDVRPIGDGLSARAEALRAYLDTPKPAGPVRRDPFTFREAPREARGNLRAGDLPGTAEPPAVPTRPEMMLSGIAEDLLDGRPVRTAVISAAGQLVFAREGDRVLSRFLVVRITADAVQLKDDERGEGFTLALR